MDIVLLSFVGGENNAIFKKGNGSYILSNKLAKHWD